MLQPDPPYCNHKILALGQTQDTAQTQAYAVYISYADWTEGHHQMMHCHDNVAEILLLLRGHGRYSVGIHRYSVQAGDVILCNSGVMHDEFPQTDEPYYTLCLGIQQLALPGLPPNSLVSEEQDPVFHNPEQFDELVSLFCMIERHAAERKPYYQTVCQHLALGALELVRRMTIQQIAPSPIAAQDTLCARVEHYIGQHYDEELTLDQLSKRFYISPYHLAHVFKQQTGYTLKQYILRRRIGEAQSRLIKTSDSIIQIASDMGFADASYFARLFAKYVGMTPTEYRNYRTKEEQKSAVYKYFLRYTKKTQDSPADSRFDRLNSRNFMSNFS